MPADATRELKQRQRRAKKAVAKIDQHRTRRQPRSDAASADASLPVCEVETALWIHHERTAPRSRGSGPSGPTRLGSRCPPLSPASASASHRWHPARRRCHPCRVEAYPIHLKCLPQCRHRPQCLLRPHPAQAGRQVRPHPRSLWRAHGRGCGLGPVPGHP